MLCTVGAKASEAEPGSKGLIIHAIMGHKFCKARWVLCLLDSQGDAWRQQECLLVQTRASGDASGCTRVTCLRITWPRITCSRPPHPVSQTNVLLAAALVFAAPQHSQRSSLAHSRVRWRERNGSFGTFRLALSWTCKTSTCRWIVQRQTERGINLTQWKRWAWDPSSTKHDTT